MDWIKKNFKIIIFGLLIVLIFVLNQRFGWSDYLSNTENLKFLSAMIRFIWIINVVFWLFPIFVGHLIKQSTLLGIAHNVP